MSKTNARQLVTQLEYAWKSLGWTVPFAIAIEGIGSREAAWKPDEQVNSIWQTVRHCSFYNERMLCRLTGVPIPDHLKAETNTATFGLLADGEDAESWQREREHSLALYEKLHAALSSISEEKLDEKLGDSTIGQELTTWVLHDAFHAGQIVLLRKQLGNWSSPYNE